MSLDDATRDQITTLIESNDVTLFMKGNRETPQCGFSATVIGILDGLLPSYHTVDVLSDHGVREGIKEFSSWPTIPQLYVKGEFLGGCDIIQEMHGSGELAAKLGIDLDGITSADVRISDAAALALARAATDAPAGTHLHLGIDARYRSSLFLAPVSEAEIEVTSNGISLYMDRPTASRAVEARVDVADTPNGAGFQVLLPKAPQVVQPMAVQELKRRLDAGERFEFIDVRTPEERATASIPGATLINEDVTKRLEALPRDTLLVFHCHHGGRSQAEAERFAALGFSNVHNLSGGIDAWSREVDSSVPRY
ncbi:MAG: Grx4 family monothiol glutaredoxin [Myxococcota bacterium]